jgi:hypothetical protein
MGCFGALAGVALWSVPARVVGVQGPASADESEGSMTVMVACVPRPFALTL